MPDASGSYEIRSEAHGPHWVAWVIRGGGAKPDRGVVIVGQTQEEAERRARQFAERASG